MADPIALPVRCLVLRWSDRVMEDERSEPLAGLVLDASGGPALLVRTPIGGGMYGALTFPVRLGQPDGDFDPDGRCLAIRRWGLEKLGPTVWKVGPSVIAAHYRLHAFLILRDVPEPAPWEE